tara:strand:+ start:838 stop:1197 length:360 start_codon:yes stop_codon:yes gene_type:complete
MTDSKVEHISNEDFLVRIRPMVDTSGTWTGDIDVAIITQPDNELDDDDYYQMMHFTKMLASTIPVMEFNEEFRDLVNKYVVETVDGDFEVEEEENKLHVVEEEGNVVKIGFNTKTKGTA